MKAVLSTIVALFFVLGIATAQEETKTEETVTTTDSTGNTKTVTVVRVSKSEDIRVRTNAIIINPLKFFFFYNVGYMHALTPTIAVGGSLQTPSLPDGITGFGFNIESRIYPSGKHLRGFYFAPNISQNWLWSGGSDGTASAFSIGGLVGWQWFPGDDFAMGLGIGIDRFFLSEDANDSRTSVSPFGDYEGPVPALRFDIGYGW